MTLLAPNFPNILHSVIDNHPLWDHPFLLRCRHGKLSVAEIRILAVQMYNFRKEFNRILASILFHCSDEKAQLVILEKLFDEMGQGDVKQSHLELFRRFTRALDMDDATLAAQMVTPETRILINTYLQIPHKYGYLAALSAVCYASTRIVSSLYSQLYQGIIDVTNLPKDSLSFFELHIDVDGNHEARLASILESSILTLERESKIKQVITELMDARLQFFNGIERQTFTSELIDNSRLLINV
ncbi:MAG: iron-containing redox enzyme family protein [Calothrix sp. MO_167.B42]|nr:iron-containing redox enzyme family protein [Calothrix sp. MO_167.B42]